nr:gliding motility-associated C-terminal domain-containing protein [Pedobacter panaciterrae]
MKTSLLKSILLLLFAFASIKVAAEGSKDLAANGGDRAHWRSSTVTSPQFPFPSLGLIKVYARVGETIYLGSSAQGIGTGTMNWRAPNGDTGSSGTGTAVGRIVTRNEEIFGPSLTNGDGGYDPYSVVVQPGQEGVWEITFIATNAFVAGGNAPITPAGSQWLQNISGWYIEAFDVSVKSTANVFVSGRAFMNLFSGNTSNVANTYGSFNGIFTVLTKDGYKYTVNPNGMQGAAFQFFANNKGFRDGAGNPLYKSVEGIGTTATTIPVHNPTSADDATNVTHKLFFNTPSVDLPASAPSGSGSVWLVNSIVDPILSNLSFRGVEGTSNLAGTNPLSGSFTFRTTVPGPYQISIDINKNGIFTDITDRILTGYAIAINTDIVVNWDGLDGQGVKVPGNTAFPPGSVKIELLSGEVHFPFLDVEKNPGGTIVTRLNGSNPDDKLYWDDSDISNIGIPSNPKRNLVGLSSSSNGHIWSGTGSNNFGNDNGMDSWAYIPSTPLLNPVAFRLAEADLEVVSITSPSVCVGNTGSFVVTVRNNGPDDVAGAKFHIDLPAGLTGTTVTPFVTSGSGLVSSSNLLAGSYDATLNMSNTAEMTFTINATVSTLPAGGFLAFKASMLRTADVTDPDATNPDAAVPTDPDAECNAAPSGVGCNNIKNVQITVNPALTTAPVTTIVQPTCAVATGSITVTAPVGVGFTYSINGIDYQASPEFTNVAPGNYTVQVKNAGDCASPVANVTINSQPTAPIAATATIVQPTCALATGTITVTAPLGVGLTYSVDGAAYQADVAFTGLVAGTYALTVKSADGCVSPATSVVINSQPATPIAATATTVQPTCALATGTITVTAPLGADLTYSVNGAAYQADVVFSGLIAGTYALTVKSADGCISPATSVVINAQPATPIAAIANTVQPTCALATGSITVTAPLGAGLTYSVDGAAYQADVAFTGLVAGTHALTAKSSDGCISPATSVVINAQPATPIAANTTTVQPTCALATGTITVTAPLGVGLTYSINGAAYQPGVTFSSLIAGTYNLTVKNADGCISPVTSVVINVQPVTPIAATATTIQPTCALATGTITVTAPLGVGLTYSVDGAAYQADVAFTGLVAGTYALTVKSADGCISPATSVVINPQPATPIAATATTVQPTCALATGTITVTAPLGAGLTYSVNGATYQSDVTFAGLIAGTYALTVKNADGCVSPATSVVINPQPATPIAATATTVQPTCALATGTITVTAPLGAGLTYSVNGAAYQSGVTFTGLVAGTYSLTVKNADGCISPATSVTINAQPATPIAATATTVQPTCALATGTITVTAPLGAGLTYSVNGATYQSDVTFAGLIAGTYSLTVKNADGCVSPATSVVINPQPATPIAATAATIQPTCALATGTITVTAPLGVGLTYSVDGAAYQADVAFTGLVAGTYSLTVKSADGCISPATSVVIDPQPATPIAATASTVQPTCALATGTITVTAPSGAGLTYSIDGLNYQTDVTFAGLTSGTYSLTVKNVDGCISPATSVVINPQPATPIAATATTIQPTCALATGTITVTAPLGVGLTYSVDGAAYQADINFTSLVSGTYSLTVKNADGCVSPANSVVIDSQPALPATPLATAVQPTCALATGSILVNSPLGAGLTYSIDGVAYQSSSTFNNLVPGVYQLTVKNAGGCVSNPTSVTIDPAPAVPLAATATSTGATCITPTGSITVTAPLGAGLTYSIDGATYQSGVLFSAVAPGDYSLTVKNAAGCISAPFAIKVAYPIPAPTISQVAVTCSVPTGTITVDVTDPADTYGLNGVYQASNVFTNLAPGSYTITAKNSSGCVSEPFIAQIAFPVEDPVINAVQPTCAVGTGSITITNPTFATGYTFSINGGTSYQAGNSFPNLNPGSYQVIVKKDVDGCLSGVINFTINPQPATPVAAVTTIVQPTCALVTGSFTVTAPLGAGLSYSINGIDYKSSPAFTAITPGIYSLTVKNADGCVSSATSVVINPQPATPIAATATTIQPTCALATGTITVTSPLGAGLTYSVDAAAYQPDVTFSGLAAGTYSLTVKNADGCISPVTSVVINPQPATPIAATATTLQPTCALATGTITVTAPVGAGLTYSINGTAYQPGVIFASLASGTYSLTVKSADGCISPATSVVIDPQPAIPIAATATTVQPTCASATGTITVTAPLGVGLTYSIDGVGYQPGVTFAGLISGTYALTVKNADGCVSPATSVTINAQPATPIAANATTVQPTCVLATGSITVTAPLGAGLTYSVNGITYQSDVTFAGLIAGTYALTVKNADGCISPATSVVIDPQPATPIAAIATTIQPTCALATGTITVTAPLGAGLTYSVDGTTYQPGVTFNSLVAGTYALTVKNADGCVSPATSVVITPQPATPIAAAATTIQPTCALATGTITVTAPLGAGLTYSVDGTTYQPGVTFNGLVAGTYALTVKNVSGCVSPATSVVINPQPAAPIAATATTVQPTCALAMGTITVTAPLGAGLTYSVDGTTYQPGVTFNSLVAGTYALTVKNASGCVSPATSVVINPQPATPIAAIATTVQPTCALATGAITVTAPLGAGLTYSIDGATYQPGVTFNGLVAGTYALTVKNASGCVSPATSVVINAVPLMPAVPVVQNINYCQNDIAVALTATGQNIKWYTTETSGSPLPAAPVPSTATAGTVTWWASQTNATGCESLRAPLTVTINAKPVITLVSSTADMTTADPPRTLVANPTGGTFTGPGVELTGTTAAFNPLTAGVGTHTITYNYTGTGNCSSSLQFSIKVSESAVKVDLAVTILTESRPIGIGEVFNNTITAENKSTNDATEAKVVVQLPPGLSFVNVQTPVGIATYDQSSGKLTWTIGTLGGGESVALKLSIKATEPGKYAITAEISSKEQDAVPANNSSSIEKEILGLFIPDVITANGDGKNDEFKIRGLGLYPVHELNILNRWGNTVYRSKAYKNDWTGEGLNDGTYYYSLKVKTTSGQWQVFKGYITLLRNR